MSFRQVAAAEDLFAGAFRSLPVVCMPTGPYHQDVVLDVVAPVLNRRIRQALLKGKGHRLRDQLPRQRVLPLCEASVRRQAARPVSDTRMCMFSSEHVLRPWSLRIMHSMQALIGMAHDDRLTPEQQTAGVASVSLCIVQHKSRTCHSGQGPPVWRRRAGTVPGSRGTHTR